MLYKNTERIKFERNQVFEKYSPQEILPATWYPKKTGILETQHNFLILVKDILYMMCRLDSYERYYHQLNLKY